MGQDASPPQHPNTTCSCPRRPSEGSQQDHDIHFQQGRRSPCEKDNGISNCIGASQMQELLKLHRTSGKKLQIATSPYCRMQNLLCPFSPCRFKLVAAICMSMAGTGTLLAWPLHAEIVHRDDLDIEEGSIPGRAWLPTSACIAAVPGRPHGSWRARALPTSRCGGRCGRPSCAVPPPLLLLMLHSMTSPGNATRVMLALLCFVS